MAKRGRKPGQIKPERKGIRLKSITLNANEHFGPQLREFRIFLNISFTALANRMGCHPSNISHFENPNGKNKFNGGISFVCRYVKALGASEVKFKL